MQLHFFRKNKNEKKKKLSFSFCIFSSSKILCKNQFECEKKNWKLPVNNCCNIIFYRKLPVVFLKYCFFFHSFSFSSLKNNANVFKALNDQRRASEKKKKPSIPVSFFFQFSTIITAFCNHSNGYGTAYEDRRHGR